MQDFMVKVHKTIAFHTHNCTVKIRNRLLPFIECSLERPVFVVGCSRAGTTLVYKTLSESEELGSLQKETHDFWAGLHPPSKRNWDSHSIPEGMACEGDRKKVSGHFYAQTGKRRIVDKNNQNGLSIPYLYKLFPDAHFVYIKRSPGDNIDSLIVGWGKSAEFGDWAEALPEQVSISHGNFKRWCFFLADGWRDYLTRPIEEVCAFQYKMMNQAILQSKPLIPKSQWHEIRYEALIESPVDEFERIFAECDLDFDKKVRKHCEEVLQKPYNTFSRIAVDKWKKGENSKRIETVLPELNKVAKALGY